MSRVKRTAFRLAVQPASSAVGNVSFERPTLFRGYAADWPATDRWRLETLASREPGLVGDVIRTQAGRLSPDARRGYAGDSESLGAYGARVADANADPGYFTCAVRRLPDALSAELRLPAPWSEAPVRQGKVWVGRAGTLSPLHFDASHNLHVQLSGRKRFRVVHPRASLALGPRSPFGTMPNFCRVELDDPVRGAASAALRDSVDVCELAPGDALYLPMGYWHEVRTEEHAVSVNFWWGTGPVAWLATFTDLAKRVRGLGR